MTQAALQNYNIGDLLGALAEVLDVPPSKYEEARRTYKAVGDWLNAADSNISIYRPDIYVQGSFALGTVIRPVGEEHHDIDAVCLLYAKGDHLTQRELKKLVGDRLRMHKTYAGLLQPEGRRCWTLQYADATQFHMDILPAIPDDYAWLRGLLVPEEFAKHAIRITDKETYGAPQWPRSNPRGYLRWFIHRMQSIFNNRRTALAKSRQAKVDDVPEYEVRTPLQRAIQIMKRHRDVKYGNDEDKPISIIITTLAALSYENEEDLSDAITKMVPRMRSHIQVRGSDFWVMNPVNPLENFADRWKGSPRKRELFFEWLESLVRDHRSLLNNTSNIEVPLAKSFGQREASAALGQLGIRSLSKAGPFGALSKFSVSHRQAPPWPIFVRHEVTIKGRTRYNGVWHDFTSDCQALPKGYPLRFYATTNVSAPYEVYWQVVNTGKEAESRRQLRGNFISSGSDLVREEATSYTGMHWVQCFIIKNGRCVAQSPEYVVNIR